MYSNDYERAKEYFEDSLALRKEIGDLEGIAWSYCCFGSLAYSQGNVEQARVLMQESYMQYVAIHNKSYPGVVQLNLGEFDMMEGNYTQSVSHYSEALSTGRRQGVLILIHNALLRLGYLALLQGSTVEAAERFEEHLAYFRKKGHEIYVAIALYNLGLLAWIRGELEQASRLYTDALIHNRTGIHTALDTLTLCGLAKVALAQGEINAAQAQIERAYKIKDEDLYLHFHMDPQDPVLVILEATAILAAAQGQMECNPRRLSVAACLLGATEVEHKRVYYGRLPRERQEREACVDTVRAAMGEQAFTAAWAQGQAMTAEQAVAYALEELG